MKYLVIIGNGLTDEPIAHKENRTILQLAQTPNLDNLAQKGLTGSVLTIPEPLHAGNDVSYLSLLGFDPKKYYAAPAEFESLALGIELETGHVPLCCDFVILQSGHTDMVMKDYTANQLSTKDAEILLHDLQEKIVDAQIKFYPGLGYHNLMVIESDFFSERLLPPDGLIGEGIRDRMPSSPVSKKLIFVMNQAQIILHNHPYNKNRQAEGKDPINSMWFWGNGSKISLPSFTKKFTYNAGVVSASNLFKGMAMSAGIEIIPVDGATGFMDTDYSAKVEAAFTALRKLDLVYLQVTAPERPSMQGLIEDKVLAVEDFDREVVGPILERIIGQNDVRILLVVNQFCSANSMKMTRDAVPFVVYPSRNGPDDIERFDEEIIKLGTEHFLNGPDLISSWVKGNL